MFPIQKRTQLTVLPIVMPHIEVHFGVVIKNPNGEPVGFRQTTKIPHISSEPSALYGVVVTSKDETPLTLGAIHIMPAKSNGDEQKVMGKPMRVVGRGAIFLQADQEDPAGQYGVEVYINHKLFTTITYELVSEQAQVRNDKPEWLN